MGKKKAGKKKVAKGAVVVKKNVAKKKSSSAAVEVDVTPMTETDAVVATLQIDLAIEDFKNPMEMSVSKLEKEAKRLYKSRVGDEFKLSFTLLALTEKNAAADQGYESKDYFTKFLGISHTKANEMIANARFLIDIGVVNIQRLIGLSWPKVKLLRNPVSKGAITKKNIEPWLDKCKAGEEGTAEWDLDKQIKELIAKKAKVELDDSLATFSFKAPAYVRDVINRFEEIAEQAFGGDRGNWYVQALSEVAAAHVNKRDADLMKARGLAALKEMAEKISPVVSLFIPLTDEISANTKLGIVSQIYQGYSEDASGVRGLQFCFAGTDAEAKQLLEVKTVRTFPVLIAKSLMPIEVCSSGSVEEFEAQATEEDIPENTLSETETFEAMKSLISSKKVSKDQFKKKKTSLLKKHAKGHELNKAMLKWLKSL